MAVRWDPSDPAANARVRAHTLAGLHLGVGVVALTLLAFPQALAPLPRPLYWSILVWLGVSALFVELRCEAVGDRTFLAVLLTSVCHGSLAAAPLVGGSADLAWEFYLAPFLVIAVVFLPRRAHAALAICVTLLLAGALAWYRLRFGEVAVLGAASETFVMAFIGLATRRLRDLAVGALAEARRGEVTDPLTGLVNRRGLDRLGPDQWRAAARDGERIAVIVVDVDHFKAVNDTLGHAAGDDLLRQLGEVLGRTTRPGDVVVRLGGEEFAVLAPVRPGEGVQVAERLRVAVGVELAPVTVSVGVTEAAPGKGDGLPEEMWRRLDEADRALYQAKSAGRNRVVSAG